MTRLSFSIDGDCSGAINALQSTEQAADHLAGRNFAFGITASGADAAIRDVSRVSDAVSAASGMVSVGADTRGLVAAQSEVSALRGGVQGLAQDLGSVGAASGSSFRTLAGDMGALGGSLSGAAGGMRDFSQASSGFATDAGRVSNAGSEIEQQMRGYSAATQQATADTRELADVQNSVRSGGTSGGRFDRGGGGGGNFGGDGGGSGGGGGFKLPPRGVPGTPDGPPLPPGSGGGEGGKGLGSGDVGAPPLAMGAMVGGVGELLAGAAGIVGVAEAIKQVPDLAYAASGAMHQFDKSVRQAAQGAIAEGVPALHQLGQALRPLGSEVGAIGAQQMGTVLGAATQLAGGATQALKNMDPAIGDAVTGLAALGGSVMSGVSSPEAVQGIKELGKSLQDPANEQGIQNLTSGIMTLGTAAAQVLTDTAGAVGQMTGMGAEKAQSPLLAAALGAFMGKGGGPLGALASAGLGFTGAAGAEADQAAGVSPTDALLAEGAGAMLPGSLGLGGKAATALGMGAKGAGPMGALLSLGGGIGGQALERGAGAVGGGKAAGAVAGALSGAELGAMIGAPFGGFGGVIGAGIGGVAGGITGYLTSEDSQQTADHATDANGFPKGQTAPYGWDKGPDGLTPSTGPHDPAGGAGWTPPPSFPRTAPTPLSQQLNQGTDKLSQSMSSLGQNTQSAIPPISQIGSQAKQSSDQVAQVPKTVQPAMDALSGVQGQASTALGQANDTIAASAEQMGTTVPASMATGIKSNTGAACNAASELSASATNCGASTLQAASPSKVFVTLGEGIGQGLAIGVQSSTPGAVSAVSRAMGSVVSAGAAGLAAASPSKTFQAMGQNLMSGAGGALGAGLQNPNQPGGTPPGAAANALAAAKNQTAIGAQLRAETEKQNKDAEKAGSGALHADPGGNAQQYSKTIMDRIAGHNENANLLKQERDQRHQDAIEGAREGISPQQVGAQRVQREQAQDRSDWAQAHPMTRADQNRGAYQQSQNPGNINPESVLQSALTGVLGKTQQQSQNLGAAIPQSMVVGMKQGQGAVSQAASGNAAAAISSTKKKLDSDSPSMEFVSIGSDISAGLALGITGNSPAVSAAIMNTTDVAGNYARDAGMVLGEVMGTNLASGLNTSITANLLKSTGLAQGITSALAKTALGQQGLLGVAGSGAQSWNLTSTQPGQIGFGGGTPANPANVPTIPTPQITVMIGNNALDSHFTQIVSNNLDQLAVALAGARR